MTHSQQQKNITKSSMFQFGIGSCLSLAVMSGIEARSWASVCPFVWITLYFVIAGTARDVLRMQYRPARIAAAIVLAICIILFILAFFNTAERVYLVNGKSYPSLLAKDIGPSNQGTLDRLHKTKCSGQMMEIYGKDSGRWVIRCGFSWISGHTFVSNTDPYADVQNGIKQ